MKTVQIEYATISPAVLEMIVKKLTTYIKMSIVFINVPF